MDSDTLLDYALFQLSPRRSRCELFVSGNGKTENIASGLSNPFVSHLRVAEEQAAKGVNLMKLNVEKMTNDGTWFKKGTLERFVQFVSTPGVLESVNTFDAEMSQLEGAKRIYSQGARDPLSGSLGENETTTEETVDITKKELLRAIDVRLVAVKQDLTTACSRASSAGFSPNNVSELLCFADYFGANRLNEACTKFISLCQRHPELMNLQHLPQSIHLPLESIDNRNVLSSSSSDMSIDEPEDEPNVAGKPTDSGNLHLHKPSNSQPVQKNAAELLGTYQQLKPIQRHFADRIVGKVMEDPVTAAPAAEPAQQEAGGDSKRNSVQDRINLFENKQKEQSVSSNNISTNVGIKRVVAGKGDLMRLPSDVSNKSVLRRWSGASDMSIDISSSSCSSFNDRKDGGSASGTPTSAGTPTYANLQFQSSGRSEERVADTATGQSQLGPEECIAVTPSSSWSSSQAEFKAFPNDRGHAEEEGNKNLIAQSKPAFSNEQGKHQMNASSSGMKFCRLSDQDASHTQQNRFSESGDHTGLKSHASCYPQSKTTTEYFVQAKDHATLQATSQAVSAAVEKAGLRSQEVFRSQTREISSQPDGVRVNDQPTLSTQFQSFMRKTNDVQAKTKDPSDFQNKSRASSVIYMESHSQGRTSPSKIVGVGGRGSAASEQPFRPILVKTKGEDSCHPGINLNEQSLAPNYMKNEGKRTHSERNNFSVRSAKECVELLDPPSASSVEQTQMVRPLKVGNRELNDELQMKANELEILFAEHKLRIHKDQAAASRRNKPPDIYKDPVLKAWEKGHAMVLPDQLPERKLVETSKSGVKFDAHLLSNMVDYKEYETSLSQRFGNKSDDFRGKFYDKYMQKRNAKLLEEWKSKRPQKEAKMKAMHESLECTLAEMRAKLVGSADRQHSNHARHFTEKLRSFSSSSASRNKDQTAVFP